MIDLYKRRVIQSLKNVSRAIKLAQEIDPEELRWLIERLEQDPQFGLTSAEPGELRGDSGARRVRRAMVGERFIVKRTWYSGLKHREGQIGEAVRVYPGSAFSRGERVVLEFSDGRQTVFARSELEPQSEMPAVEE